MVTVYRLQKGAKCSSCSLESSSRVRVDYCFSLYVTETLLHRLFTTGKLKPVIYHEVFPLDRLVEGLDAIAQRKTYGKAILHIKDEPVSAKPKL